MSGSRLPILLLWMLGAVSFTGPVSGAANASFADLQSAVRTGAIASPVWLEGTVTFVDPARKRLVLQNGDEVLALHADLADEGLRVGSRVELEGEVTPLFPACPGFPESPDGRQIRDTFEAPPDWAEHFLSRLRGSLHPPVSGDYTFWIASDDSSELWLSESNDPAGARRIAQVGSGRWTEPRQWTRISSQQSAPIRLEAGKSYSLEAIAQDATSRDNLAVAWQGPGFARRVIDGKFVTPWPVAGRDAVKATNGVLWEYWTNFYSSDFSVLRTPDDDVLKLTQAKLLKCEAGQLPAPLVVQDGQPLDARVRFRRVELEGRVQFLSRAEGGWVMELKCGRARVTARIRAEQQPGVVLPVQSLVQVSGFFEPTHSLERETHSGTLWVNGSEAITWLDTPENWSLVEELPQQRLTAANPELSVGRMVRTQGRVIAQVGTDLWRFEGKDTIQGYLSPDATNWSPAGPAIELDLSNEVLAGFAISSHRTGELAMVEFDNLSGLSSAFSGSDIGNPPVAGGLDDLGGSFRVRGSGDDIWHQSDQCFFAYQQRAGDFEFRVRLAELRGPDTGTKAVLMVRESLAGDAPWGGLVVMPGYRVGVQGRQESGGTAVGALTVLNESDRWLKLARQRNSFLVRTTSDSLQTGQVLEVLGEVGWHEQNLVLERPRIRKRTAAADRVATVTALDQFTGDLRDVPVGELTTEAKNAQRLAHLVIVRTRGVVTFNDPVGNEWYSFIQDQSGSVRVRWRVQSLRQSLRVGDWVEITGTPTLTGSGAELAAHGVTRLGGGELPVPARFQMEATKASDPDGQWTEVEGVGRSSTAANRLVLMSRTGGIEIHTGALPSSHFTNWVNARIRARGVMLRRPGPVLLLPSERHLQVVEAPPDDAFGIPIFPVRTLQTMAAELRPARRLKLAGTVTCRRSGWLVMQDKSGGIQVESPSVSDVKVGDEIEAVGFPAGRGIGVALSDALLRPAGQGRSVAPAEFAPDNFVQAQKSGTLVSVEAVLLAQHPGGEMQTLDVQSGQRAFLASLPVADGRLPHIAVGSRLRLTGVAVVDGAASARNAADDVGLMGSLELLLRSPQDVVVVERPPWWNWKHTAAASGLAVVGFAGAVLWIRTLRKRVEERTRELRETMGKLQRETQISATLAERDRLAAEIHDSVEQGLSAIMMQMEAATMVDDLHEVKRHLEMARNMAGFSRSEVQHAVWDLQSPLLENADLVTALRRVAHDISAGDTPRVTVEVSGNAFQLASAVEHHLLRMAQEAITNAVKHGMPKTISLTLHYTDGALTLTVRDDGRGFVPEAAFSYGGHFGLQGMHTRAEKMRARLVLNSKPGEGACVQITVPRESRAAQDEPDKADDR